MSDARQPLSLRWQIDPPVSLVTDGAVDLGVLFSLRRNLAERPPCRLDLVVAQVGDPRPELALELRQAFTDIRDSLREKDRLTFIGTDGLVDPSRLDAWFERPTQTLASALTGGAQALTRLRSPESACRLLVVVNTAVSEPMQDLLGAAGALSEQAIGVELFAAHPAADLGLLTRLANLGGGGVRVSEPKQSLALSLVDCVETLRDQRALDVQIELMFSPIVQPGRLFRVSPSPVFLRNIRLPDDNRQLLLEVGPVTASGPDPAFLLTATLPKRRVGRYRLFDARVFTRGSGERPVWSGGTVQQCSADPAEASVAEAQVVASRDRVELTAWAEEVARAYAEGDARRVSTTLDRLIRQCVTLGRTAAVEQISAMRLRFLGSGALGRADVNKLRRLAARPEMA